MKLRHLSKPKTLFLVMVIFICALLVYANGVAFNLFSAPSFVNDTVVFAALGVALIFTVITLTVIFRDMGKRGVSVWAKKPQMIASFKAEESISSLPEASSVGSDSLSSDSQFLQAIKAQRSEERIEIELSQQDSQIFKQPKAEPTKLICPACRKEFEMPAYLGDLMVDFGPRKPSNLIKECRHCGTIIPLKQTGVTEEDLWK